jgi:hypothetical protein
MDDIYIFLEKVNGKPVNAVWPNRDALVWTLTPTPKIRVILLYEKYTIQRIHDGKVEVYEIKTVEELKNKLSEFDITL